jgi:alpha-beta hydrolase superfamily lysophospholipase
MWVEWARTMATHGFASARVDLTGIGDSPARPGQPVDHPYGPASVTDIVEAVRRLDDGDGVVAVGLCSGARNAVDAAALVSLRGVCAINPPLHLSRAVIAPTSPLDPTPDDVERINAYHPVRHRLLAHVPTVAWRALDGLHVVPSRARAVQDAVDSGADVLVVAGADDFYLGRVRRDSAWHLARLAAGPRFRLATVERVDHGLFAPIGRDEVLQIVTDHVVATFGSAGLAGHDLEPLHAP